MLITRRVFFPIAGVALLDPIATGFQGQAAAATRPRRQAWRHGFSLFGDLKYPAGFPHFDYVNANAPKGGAVRQAAFGTYDNFNMVVAGWKGKLAVGLDLTYETLLMPSLDEASTAYGCSPRRSRIRRISLPSPIVCVRKRNGTTGSR